VQSMMGLINQLSSMQVQVGNVAIIKPWVTSRMQEAVSRRMPFQICHHCPLNPIRNRQVRLTWVRSRSEVALCAEINAMSQRVFTLLSHRAFSNGCPDFNPTSSLTQAQEVVMTSLTQEVINTETPLGTVAYEQDNKIYDVES
jgi:hypothetical protein